jgi:hypothetical protein
MVSMLLYVGFYGLLVLWAVSTHPSGGVQGGVVVGEERSEIHWKRPTLFWSCLTLFHHSSLVNLQKQAVPERRRKTID